MGSGNASRKGVSWTPDMDRKPPPRISIVLPTLNGEDELQELLPALRRQEVEGGFELLAVDSESEDRTVELLEAFGASVERIPRSTFQHGATRNRCAARARGEVLVFLSQDVVPEGSDFLATLAGAFGDPQVAGVCARVLPHEDDDPLTARTVLELPEAGEEPWVRGLDGDRVWDLAPRERGRRLRFNNVASAIRTSVFREIPFPPTAFGEDFAWAARALTHGWKIAFEPRAVARHAHSYTLAKAYARYEVDARFHHQVHGWRLRPSLWSVARGVGYEVWRDLRYLASHRGPGRLAALLRSPLLRAVQAAGQYAGGRGGGRGGPEPRIWLGSAP